MFNNIDKYNDVKIKRLVDNSDAYIKRGYIEFENGFTLSVIRGAGTYGNEDGLFEIAILDPNGRFNRSMFDDEDFPDDDVLGWCDQTKVEHYIHKVGKADRQIGSISKEIKTLGLDKDDLMIVVPS